jgi:hypothetical protein
MATDWFGTYGLTMIDSVIIPAKPYIELTYNYMYKQSSESNIIRGTQVWLMVDGTWHPLCWVSDYCNKMEYEEDGKWGVVRFMSIDVSDNKNCLHPATIRIYPSAAATRDGKLTKVRITGVWDNDENGGTAAYTAPGIATNLTADQIATHLDRVGGDRFCDASANVSISNTSVPTGASNVKFDRPTEKTLSASVSGVNYQELHCQDGTADANATVYYKVGYSFWDNTKQSSTLDLGNSSEGTLSPIFTNYITSIYDGYVLHYHGYVYGTLTVLNGSRNGPKITQHTVDIQIPTADVTYNVLGCPYIKNLQFAPSMFSKSIDLTWEYVTSGRFTNGTWKFYIFRNTTDDMSTATLIGEKNTNTPSYKDDDDKLEYDKTYYYYVVPVRTDWDISKLNSEAIRSITTKGSTSITRSYAMKLYATGGENSIKLKWTYGKAPGGVTFQVLRRISNESGYNEISKISVGGSTADTCRYEDTAINDVCNTYYYKIVASLMETTFTSDSVTAALSGHSSVTGLEVSKSTYANMVRIAWKANQKGSDATRYMVKRRILGTTTPFSTIYTTEGTAKSYSYEDNSALPGVYYEYGVWAYYSCKGDYTVSNNMTESGFSMSTGTISGRITYGTGVAVADAKVNLIAGTDETAVKGQFYSMRVSEEGGGIVWPLTQADGDTIFGGAGKAFSLEMWVRPDQGIVQSVSDPQPSLPRLIDAGDGTLGSGFNLTLHAATDSTYEAFLTTPDNVEHDMGIALKVNVFSHLTLSCNGNKTWTLRKTTDTGDSLLSKQVTSDNVIKWSATQPYIDFGMPSDNDKKYSFTGYLDEIRIWTKELTDKDVLRNFNRLLSGTESGLRLYWPLDENINGQQNAFDYSKTGGVSNGNHGNLAGCTPSTIVPSADQLSLYGLTDQYGNYVIRGVPFSGEGTNYIVRPTLGIHEFSPQQNTRFVSASSLNHSAVDFSDVSSFPVKGVVYYKNTDYPVAGVSLYVDGSLASKDGQACVTDVDGKYEISVPIGDHYISVEMTGHVFSQNGRYPADPSGIGKKFTFTKAVSNLTFYDSTLVVIAGRVVGGDIQLKKALGFGLSTNNIGTAKIKLSAGDTYRLNVNVVDNGTTYSIDSNPSALTLASPTLAVGSTTAVEGTDNNGDVRYIDISTDPSTGEFAALVPPLKYKVTSIKVPDNVNLTFTDLPIIDATNPMITSTDTLYNKAGEVSKLFTYCASMSKAYYSTPNFTVTDTGADTGFFGDKSFSYQDGSMSKAENVNLYDTGGYKFGISTAAPNGLPVFDQETYYRFVFKGSETYYNYDDPANVTKDEVPLSGAIVTVSNEMSANQSICVKEGNDDNGNAVVPGQVVDLKTNEVQLDSTGTAVYKWMCGLPNIVAPYTRSMTLSYSYNSRNYEWDGYNNIDGVKGLTAIVFGQLSSGTNFVTQGPDKLQMVLRDPPGSDSFSSIAAGTTVTHTSTNKGSFKDNSSLSMVNHWGKSTQILKAAGGSPAAIVGDMTEFTSLVDFTAGASCSREIANDTTTTTTFTTTKTISTSSSHDFVGSAGDVFMGTSTNILFGNARQICLKRATDGTYSIGYSDVISTGSAFSTEFTYTQHEVENTLIPNMQKLRNSLLIPVSADVYNGNKYVNQTDSAVFITTLDPSDSRFGTSNNDKTVWGDDASTDAKVTYPSYKQVNPDAAHLKTGVLYTDKVLYYNQQIANWVNILYENERAKVKAFNDRSRYLSKNYSFDGGTTIENSAESDTTSATNYTSSWELMADIELSHGQTLDKWGYQIDGKTSNGYSHEYSKGTETTKSITTSFTLAQSGSDDVLTVDVYNDPYGHGAIFRAVGGQTSCPYEGQEVTKYYKPGTEIGTATMQMEIPHIEAQTAVINDVPSGKKATFTLKLDNLSETGSDATFVLKPIESTNPDGAILSLSTGPLAEGHSVVVSAGKTLNLVLQLAQSKPVLDYNNIGLVLTSSCDAGPVGENASVSDTCYISAHFVPSSSDITLAIENRTVNMFTDTTVTMVLKDYDANYRNLKAIRIQYKGEHDVNWALAKEYVINAVDTTHNNELLPAGGRITYKFDMRGKLFPDQTYQFRAVTACTYGTGEVQNTSDIISVVKDISRPQELGSPTPVNGILTSDDDISVVYNEAIKSSQLTDANNFIVTGALNGAKIANDVALQCNGASEAAYTQADIPLAGKSFAVDTWLRYHGAGTIFSHGNGNNKFSVGTDDKGHLALSIGGAKYVSTDTVPQNKWVFLAFTYDYAQGGSHFSALVANDESTTTLFNTLPVADYMGVGHISLGSNLQGALHELTLWDRARTLAEAQAGMHLTKSPSTPYLIGYWKFDEGEGTLATDYARSRHMTLPVSSWYLNNTNKALTLNGSTHVDLDITRCSATDDENYAYEMWFRGAAQSGAATLFSLGERILSMGFDASGNLTLTSNGVATNISSVNYLDNNWHHLALNVLRNGNAITYVDGTAVKQMAASQVATFASSCICLGAQRTGSTYGSYFKGSVDEVRFWKATLSADVIRHNRNCRLVGDTVRTIGLMAYYPFEKQSLDTYQQVVTDPSLVDAISDSLKAVCEGITAYSDDAPALKPANTETNLNFSFVASSNTINIKLDETAAALEGCTVNFCVRNVRDANDNISQAIHWSAYVRQNQLLWADDGTSLKQKNQEETTFTATFSNQSGANENWSLSNIPSWLTASETQGTLKPLSTKTITFTVSSATPIGKYEETIYLSGNKAISEPYTIDLEVSGDEPNWTVDKSAYETNMNVIGQLQVMGIPSEDVSDKVAAFIDGQCRGVASPVYYQRYDSYYTIMDIYGNASDAGKSITFKVWDASTGIIYPTVDLSYVVGFTADKVTGDMTNPFVWNAKDQIEQDIALSKGWNWISLNMTSNDMTVSNVLSGIKSATEVIKGKTAFSQPSGDDWAGKLTRFYVGDMYKIKTTAPTALTMTGTAVKAVNEPITIQPNWNWIGCNTTYNMTVADAFAGITPTDGDQVKGQAGFALYQKYGWVGTLKSIVPGRGYMYLSKNTQSVTFTYPSSASTTASLAPAYAPRQAGVYTPVSENAFPGNMTMVAKVVNGNSVISGAEVGVFAADGCRSDEVSNSDGIVFLTIAGEGTGDKLTFKVYNGGSTTEVDQGLIYIDDATYGTMSAPYLIQMDPTAINSASAEGVHVYPTRVVSDVNVDASNIKRITLQDTGGRLLFSRTTNLTEHNVIPMSEYADGIYFVVVQTATQGTVIRRILKMAK